LYVFIETYKKESDNEKECECINKESYIVLIKENENESLKIW